MASLLLPTSCQRQLRMKGQYLYLILEKTQCCCFHKCSMELSSLSATMLAVSLSFSLTLFFFFNLIYKVASEGRLHHSLSAFVRAKRMQIGGSMLRLSENNSQLEEGYAICQTRGLPLQEPCCLEQKYNMGCVLNCLCHKGGFTPHISANI